MKEAADNLAATLADITFKQPSIAVINNVDVAIESDPQAIKQALVRQLYGPVRWTETIELLAANGVENALEIGPGKVLQGLMKRITKNIKCQSVNDQASLDALVQ